MDIQFKQKEDNDNCNNTSFDLQKDKNSRDTRQSYKANYSQNDLDCI